MLNNFYVELCPETFTGLVGLDWFEARYKYLTEQGVLGRVLITGPFGHGKSTLARILTKRTYCTSPIGMDPCLSCDACTNCEMTYAWSSDVIKVSGDALTREYLRDLEMRHLRYVPSALSQKVLFVDDVDLASEAVQVQLVGTMNRCLDNSFLFTASSPQTLPEPLRQRCNTISLPSYSQGSLEKLVKSVCERTGIAIKEIEAVHLIIQIARSNPRVLLNLLEHVKALGGELTRQVLSSMSMRA